jgi:protease-4
MTTFTLRRLTSTTALLLAVAWCATTEARAEKSILRLVLDGPVMEKPNDAASLMALFKKSEARTLHQLVKTIRQAANSGDIAGLVLVIEQPQINLPQIEELTRALKAFQAKGKKVYCYLDYAGNGAYALASAADHITLAENGQLDILGLHGELMYFKGLLDKIGVEADMMHCGAYKSALEPFTRTEPSPEAAENINWLLDGIYDRWLQLIAAGRRLSAEEVKKLIDAAPLTAQRALESKLIDEVSTYAAFKARLHKEFGKDVKVLKRVGEKSEFELDTSNPFALIPQIMEMFETAAEHKETPALGLIYLEGPISTGKADDGPFGDASVGSTTARAAFEQARDDTNIKAVVVRVDSPGGSALASDIIWNAAVRCAAEKPVIVSMGRVAGSGGYYVALPGETIFAEATTITGSIGVVGGKIVWKGLFEDKLGITTTEFNRGAHAALMSANRKWNDTERTFMLDYMTSVYDQFKGRVAKSRGSKIKKDLESIAGGRVYTGAQALELGLIDKLGGLGDALDYAAGKGGLGRDYEVRQFPKPSGLEEFLALLGKLTGKESEEDEYEIGMAPAVGGDPLVRAVWPLVRDLAPPQLREVLRGLRNLLLLQQERVGCFMPLVPTFR